MNVLKWICFVTICFVTICFVILMNIIEIIRNNDPAKRLGVFLISLPINVIMGIYIFFSIPS